MKADLSRSTFEQGKHYRAVRWQMGRVPLDADVNEQADIAAHRVETETIDVVGESGAPVHDAAFQIATLPAALPPAQQAAATALGALAPGDFFLSAGRYYVNGVMCENDAPIRYSDQAAGDLPDTTPLLVSGLYLVYLDVWTRHVSFLDDPRIREVALGGPDTTTRQRTVWQVRALRVGNAGAVADCDTRFEAYDQATAPSTGTLAAEVDPTPASTKPCVLPPGGGYRRQENQLYRVEIHAAGAAGTATFKWSRDNGAVVSGWEATAAPDTIRLTQPPRDEVMGFSVGDTVELTDDRNDLLGLPGALLEITKVAGANITLDAAVPAGFAQNPKVRRWDGTLDETVVAGTWIDLEDGVRVRFTAGTYATGDYWMIPARTATGDVEWPRAAGAAQFVVPQGIAHQYARVGYADFDGTTITPRDCRRLFLPLTEIESGADLRLHNQHLHGKGVVCGLQVNCVAMDPGAVRVRIGHAIDCSGTDILLEQPRRLAVVERAKALGLLDAQGSGDVQITMAARVGDVPAFDVRAAAPEPDTPAAILKHIIEGTIWQDFYDDCLRPLADYLRSQLADDSPNDTALVSRQKKLLLTVTNLLAHRGGGAPNRRLWLSEEQHGMLARLYGDLLDLARRSKSFCALGEDLPSFPSYPFAKLAIRTAFAARQVRGVRMLADSALAVAWSDDAPGQLHVFELKAGEMIRDVKLEDAEGLAIQDVALAATGKRPVLVVASAMRDAASGKQRTVLSLLDPEANKVLGSVVVQDEFITRVEAHPFQPGVLLALSVGRGVHFLELAKLGGGPLALDPPRWQFPAAGHLALINDRACATENATAAASTPGQYNALRFGRLGQDKNDRLENVVALSQLDNTVRTGEDGIAFAGNADRVRLHVVVNPPLGSKAKCVLVVDPDKVPAIRRLELPLADDGGETGPVGIASVQRPALITYALSKRNQLLWTPVDSPALPVKLTLPAQAAPVALSDVPAQGPQFIVAANRESMTLTLVPAKVLGNSDANDAGIGSYRDALVAAFEQLARILVQSLKDCLCEHLLVNCPRCADDGNEVLALARVEIREGRVYKVCNFGRQEVLTFPKVKYWLSAVPIIPLVSFLVERFCCWVIAPNGPSAAAAAGAGGAGSSTAPTAAAALFTPAMAFGAMSLFRDGRIEAALGNNLTRAKVLGSLLTRSAIARTPVPSPTPPPEVRITDVVDRDAAAATATLAETGVIVSSVEDYDAAVTGRGIDLKAGKLPATLQPGEQVKLYTRGDRVMFYQVVPPDAPSTATTGIGGTSPAPNADVQAEVDDLRTQLDQLRTAHAQEIAARDRDLAELKLTDVNLNAELRRMAAAPPPSSDLKGSIDTLRQEMAAMRDAHDAELTVRDGQIRDLKTANDRLALELNDTTKRLQTDITRLGRLRPPG